MTQLLKIANYFNSGLITSDQDEKSPFGNARKEFVQSYQAISDLAAVPDNVIEDDLKVLREMRTLLDKILEANEK